MSPPSHLRVAALVLPLVVMLGCGGGGETGSTSSGSTSGGSGGGGTGGNGAGGSLGDPSTFSIPPESCAYSCPPACAESTTPYACPNLLPWDKVPHADSCPSWDGTFPAPKPGKCTVTDASDEAAKYAGVDPDDASILVMPGGRRLSPAGTDFVFPDQNTMTSNVVAVPGTGFVLTVDTGNGDHIVRVVDPALVGASNPTLGQVNFPPPEALNQAIAFSPPDRVYVASAQGVVQALTLDAVTGALTRDDARSVALPASPPSPGGTFYASGVAVSTDDTRLFASGVQDSRLVVADVTAGGANYGATLGQVDLGHAETYAIYVDPHDPATHFVYVTMWADASVVEVDVSNAAAPLVARTFAVDKDPEGLAFLDARWMVVGNDLGDTLSLVDRVTGTVTSIPVDVTTTHKGVEPSSLVYDAANHRLYATQAGLDAVGAYDVDLTTTPPTIAPAGRLPSQWWPSGVAAMPNGDLVVTSLMARGIGPRDPALEYELLRGGIQHVPAPSGADLAAGETRVLSNTKVFAQPGQPKVTCPAGADDFPVPTTNTGEPSSKIDHVFIVVRENKSFDGLFGDLPGVRGDPTGTIGTPAQMATIWPNVRTLATTFAHSDNFYTTAFLSNQGHLWATHGRTDDFNEREWPVVGYGRNLRGVADSGGVNPVTEPAEGSMFQWLGDNHVPYDILGEIVGSSISPTPTGHDPFDVFYPGGLIQNIGYPDNEKACYVAGRARVRCDLGNVVYMTLPNDHTQGVSPTSPSPETMFAVNDEATGLLVDGISHSPLWPKSLVIVMEDDPANGSESVDYHRTILVMASPWLKRAYVSHAQLDVSSVHKLVAHLFALPYPNVEVENAALPLDMFTSTPDTTPFTYQPRKEPLSCGTSATEAEARLTASWDLDDVDEAPGLGPQIDRWMKHRQLTELPPDLEAQVALRERARK